MMNRQRDF